MAITLTMYFSGGMIPSYLNIRNLHLLNTVWAIILPGAINTFNLILAKTFFGSIPAEIEDAALIDGASVTKMFLRIILPISKAMVGVIMLYYLVSRWNTYYYALLYLSSAPDKYPLQMVLREILINNIRNAQLLGDSSPELAEYYAYLANQIKYSVIVVAAVPMLILYPFLQKFFDKGVMLGSVKG